MFVLAHKSDSVDQVTFAPTGQYLGVGHDWRYLTLWDLTTQLLFCELGRAGGYSHAEFRFHPTRSGIYHMTPFGDSGEVYWVDPIGNDAEDLVEGAGLPEKVLLTLDATRLLVHNLIPSEFRLYDLTKGIGKQPIWIVPVFSGSARRIRVNVEFLPGEERFIVAEHHGNSRTRISVRSLATGEVLAVARSPNRYTRGLAVASDGSAAVVLSGMSLFVYDPAHLKLKPRKVKNDNRKEFTGIAFHPSGKYLAATSNDATVKLFDTTTWTIAKTFTWNIGRMRSIAFSPDGTLAAAGSDTGRVVVWDVDL